MIDLHTHTYYSDGTLSPEALVKQAKEEGIDLLAITDHDGVDGLKEGRMAAEKYGIDLMSGVELSAQLFCDIDCSEEPFYSYMHILGYDFDPENAALLARLREIRQKRKERNDKMLQVLAELGFSLSVEDVQVYPGQDYIGKPSFARALVKKGYAKDVQTAFASEEMLAAPTVKAIHRVKIDAAEAISLIQGAGGRAVLAHPAQVTYKEKREDPNEVFWERLSGILTELVSLGLTGMECHYSAHTKEETDTLLSMAKALNLWVTSGSDYHGPDMKKGTGLGRYL